MDRTDSVVRRTGGVSRPTGIQLSDETACVVDADNTDSCNWSSWFRTRSGGTHSDRGGGSESDRGGGSQSELALGSCGAAGPGRRGVQADSGFAASSTSGADPGCIVAAALTEGPSSERTLSCSLISRNEPNTIATIPRMSWIS